VRAVEVREETLLERPLDAADSAPRGLGREVRVMECETCDARVTFEGASTSEPCPFCGSPSVLPQESRRQQLRPESLLPLAVGKADVHERFRAWVRSRWFRPDALREAAAREAVGVYVPAWTFDAFVRSEWSAQSGTYYYVTETYTVTVNGKPQMRTRQVRRTRWWPSWGNRSDRYDDLLVLASRGIDEGLARELGDFDTTELVPYAPEYLAGWRAEEYQVDLLGGWEAARARIESIQRDRCARDVPGDTHRALRVKNAIRDVRWKHVLLPMWSVTYDFRGESYAVLVHGRTGAIVGRAPYSWVKISLAVLGAVAVAAGLALAFGGAR